MKALKYIFGLVVLFLSVSSVLAVVENIPNPEDLINIKKCLTGSDCDISSADVSGNGVITGLDLYLMEQTLKEEVLNPLDLINVKLCLSNQNPNTEFCSTYGFTEADLNELKELIGDIPEKVKSILESQYLSMVEPSNPEDLINIKKCLIKEEGCDPSSADVSGNGVINGFDLYLMEKILNKDIFSPSDLINIKKCLADQNTDIDCSIYNFTEADLNELKELIGDIPEKVKSILESIHYNVGFVPIEDIEDPEDLINIKKCLTGSDCDVSSADVSGNGVITGLDLYLMEQTLKEEVLNPLDLINVKLCLSNQNPNTEFCSTYGFTEADLNELKELVGDIPEEEIEILDNNDLEVVSSGSSGSSGGSHSCPKKIIEGNWGPCYDVNGIGKMYKTNLIGVCGKVIDKQVEVAYCDLPLVEIQGNVVMDTETPQKNVSFLASIWNAIVSFFSF